MSVLSRTDLNPENISLSEFTEGLIASLISEGVKVPNQNPRWHEFFYYLSKSRRAENGRPEFFHNPEKSRKKIQFDWDAHYPKSPYLSEVFHGIGVLHLSSGLDGNIHLDNRIVRCWMQKVETYSPELRQYHNYTVERAKRFLLKQKSQQRS